MDDARLDFFLGPYERAVSDTLNALNKSSVLRRIWLADYTVWKPAPDEIINRLGWLHAPEDTLKQLSYIDAVLRPVIAEGYKNAVLLGMGGSSLAADVFRKIFGRKTGYPNLLIWDSTDPFALARISQTLQPEETFYFVSSKSGTTLETVLLFHYFYNSARNKLGQRAGGHFIIITDPDSPLEDIAYRLSLRHVFLSNPAIGGRYAALSFPGIVPAMLAGTDVDRLLQNALAVTKKEMAAAGNNCTSTAGLLGAALGALALRGRNKLTFIFPPLWKPLGGWLEQLIAESTGKEGRGIIPVCEDILQEPATYNDDRLFVVFQSKTKPAAARISQIIAAGHPVITVKLTDKFQLGGQMFLWEMATAVAGHILGINPFNQPDVEATKTITRRIIDLYRGKKELPSEKAFIAGEDCSVYLSGESTAATPAAALVDFLNAANKSAYVCLQIFLKSTPEINAALRRLRAAIRSRYRLAVTIGYGPRYLHSIGQLHKGDAGKGLFIQFTAGNRRDIDIPDGPGSAGSTLTFGTLQSAQAIGDRQVLIGLGRKVIRFHLKKHISANIKLLADYLQKITV